MKTLDEKDREILTILSKEARIPMKALAARISLSRSATAQRVTALEYAGIIKGYRADIAEIDQQNISAYLTISLRSTPARDVIDLLARFPEVRRVSSLGGTIDLIVEVIAPSIAQLTSLRTEIAGREEVDKLTTHVVLHRDIERIS